MILYFTRYNNSYVYMKNMSVCVCMCVCMYVYIYMGKQTVFLKSILKTSFNMDLQSLYFCSNFFVPQPV